MAKVSDLHQQWIEDQEYAAEYENLKPEFELAEILINVNEGTNCLKEQTNQNEFAILSEQDAPPTRM